MRSIMALVASLVFLSCSYAPRSYQHYERVGSLVIDENVGEVIDVEERAQYHLFWNIDQFEAAQFYTLRDGGYEVEILTKEAKLRAVNRDIKAVPILMDHVGRYEGIPYPWREYEERWKIIDYDTLGFAITNYEISQIGKRKLAQWGGGIAGFLLGVLPAAYLGGESKIAGFVALTLCTYVGIRFGERSDRKKAVNAVKEARRPEPIE